MNREKVAKIQKEFDRRVYLTSFQRSFQLNQLLLGLQTAIIFALDAYRYFADLWDEEVAYQYIFWWRFIYILALVGLYFFGRRCKSYSYESHLEQYRNYVYILVSFSVLMGAVRGIIDVLSYSEDLSVYTLSSIGISVLVPLPRKWVKDFIYGFSWFILISYVYFYSESYSDFVRIFFNSLATLVISIFCNHLVHQYFKTDYFQLKKIESQAMEIANAREVSIKLRERQETIESVFNFIHSGPLQTLASIIRYASSSEVNNTLLSDLKELNSEIRQVNQSLSYNLIDDENAFYIRGTDKIDLELPLDELLYEVYNATLDRDLIYFRELKVKIPDFESTEGYYFSVDSKKQICAFLEEALCNVGKHAAGATRLEVLGKLEGGHYSLSVIDNGVGLVSFREGEGTKSFRKIVANLNGTFRRINLEPKGTLCGLRWPLTASNQSDFLP